MIKVLVKKKLNEDVPAQPATLATTQPATLTVAQPSTLATTQPAVQLTTLAPAQPADANTQQTALATTNNAQQTQPADNTQQAIVLDAKALTDGVNAFSDGIAKQILASCAHDALAKTIPQLINAGKMDEYKALIEPINKAMAEIKSAQSAADIITKYSELMTGLNNLVKSAAEKANANELLNTATQTQPTA